MIRGFCTVVANALGDSIHAISALVDGVLNERQPAKLACDKKVFNTGFVFFTDHWDVGSRTGLSHDHGDGAHRALLRAEAVANAFMTVYYGGFAIYHSQDIAFRTGRNAGSTPNAVVRVDFRMLRLRSVRKECAAIGGGASLSLSALVSAPIAKKKES
jgi:hypothetical protein